MTGTTNTANPTCNGFLSYSQVGNPRNFMPTERFRFQSNYFKNFEMSGSVGYSTSDYHFSDLFGDRERLDCADRAARKHAAGGPIKTKRVSVNADWSGVYAVNDKLRILDLFRYDNWRIPGVWDTADTNFSEPLRRRRVWSACCCHQRRSIRRIALPHLTIRRLARSTPQALPRT